MSGNLRRSESEALRVSIFLYPRDVPKIRIYNKHITNVSKPAYVSGKHRRSESELLNKEHNVYRGDVPKIRIYNEHITNVRLHMSGKNRRSESTQENSRIAWETPEDPNIRYTVNQRQLSLYISGNQGRSESTESPFFMIFMIFRYYRWK